MEKEPLNRLIQIAIAAALKAGKAILEVYYSPGFDVEWKEDESPVTIADRRASEIIVQELAASGYPVISEEEVFPPFEERRNWDFLWMVDPLDGTREFVNKRGDFTVNIALIEKDHPVIGVVYIPMEGSIYFGGSPIGSYKAIEVDRLSVEEIIWSALKLPLQHHRDKFTMVGSRSHMNAETLAFFEKIRIEKGEENVGIVIRGSSLKMCIVAEGIADLYPRLGHIMEWDTAAGHAICEGAGCVVSQWDGSRLRYNKIDFYQPWFRVSK